MVNVSIRKISIIIGAVLILISVSGPPVFLEITFPMNFIIALPLGIIVGLLIGLSTRSRSITSNVIVIISSIALSGAILFSSFFLFSLLNSSYLHLGHNSSMWISGFIWDSLMMQLLFILPLILGSLLASFSNMALKVKEDKTNTHNIKLDKKLILISTVLILVSILGYYYILVMTRSYNNNALLFGYLIIGLIVGLVVSIIGKFESIYDGAVTIMISFFLSVAIMIFIHPNLSLLFLMVSVIFFIGSVIGIMIYRKTRERSNLPNKTESVQKKSDGDTSKAENNSRSMV